MNNHTIEDIDMELIVKRRCEIHPEHVFIEEYGFSIAHMWAVTGYHQGIPLFECPRKQHWGCTPQCAIDATIRCLQNEHNAEALLAKHEEAMKDGHPKVSEYFKPLYEKYGDDFHILSKDRSNE